MKNSKWYVFAGAVFCLTGVEVIFAYGVAYATHGDLVYDNDTADAVIIMVLVAFLTLQNRIVVREWK
jgi:hypothetical protein